MASDVTRDNLKGYFNTGDVPTESNFEDLIDSNLNLTDGGTVTGTFTIGGIQSAAATDAAHLPLMVQEEKFVLNYKDQ